MVKQVILTRPAAEADDWQQGLRAAGLQVVPLPLIEIRPVLPPVLPDLPGSSAGSALMFVSVAAVRSFFGLSGTPARLPEQVRLVGYRIWVTGPGSAAALLRAGMAPERLDMPPATSPNFDSESLWTTVGHQVGAGFRLLVVRGRDMPGGQAGRSWLADKVIAAGGEVSELVVYERAVPQWVPARLARARQAATDGSIWLFSSSQAIANLQRLLPEQPWNRALAVATHARIAETAREAGFGVVVQCRADLSSVIASIESTDGFADPSIAA